MYSEDEPNSANMRENLSQELERLREQSRISLEKTWKRVEELQEEGEVISNELVAKERKLQELKLLRNPHHSEMEDVLEKSHRSASSSGMASSFREDDSRNGSVTEFDPEDDVRVQLMIQEREEKILEIREVVNVQDYQLQSLQDDTAVQQETIQELHRELDELQAKSGPDLEAKVADKEEELADLEDQLEIVQKGLTDIERSHLELEEEWNEREDLVADAEAESVDRVKKLQSKLEKYSADVAMKEQQRTLMMQSSSETLEGLRQDLMDYLGPETSHNLMLDLRKSFEALQEKEDELSGILVNRLYERTSFAPIGKRRESHSADSIRAIRYLGNLSEKFDYKLRSAAEGGREDMEDLISAIQEKIAHSFGTAVEEITWRLDTMKEFVMGMSDSESEDEHDQHIIDVVTRSVEKLSYTIQAKLRQMHRALPDSEESDGHPNYDQHGRQSALRIESLLISLGDKKEELRAVEEDLELADKQIDAEFDKATKRVEFFEKHVQFLTDGLNEKDRIVDGVLEIIKERRDAEIELMEELTYVYRNEIIGDSDFQESDKFLLEKLYANDELGDVPTDD